jgi:ABC-type proline/glycine betaine transport system ATPase subunit
MLKASDRIFIVLDGKVIKVTTPEEMGADTTSGFGHGH